MKEESISSASQYPREGESASLSEEISSGYSEFPQYAKNMRRDNKQEQVRFSEAYMYPGTITKAKQHEKAMKCGWNPEVPKNYLKKNMCPCCKEYLYPYNFRLCESTTVSICDKVEDLEGIFRIPSGISLFFTYVKFLISLCFLRFILVDAINLLTNIFNGTFCQQSCSRQFYTYASTIYKYGDKETIVAIDCLSFLTTVVLMLYFLIFRRAIKNMYDKLDALEQTQDDFTIFVENIPIIEFDRSMEIQIGRKNLKELKLSDRKNLKQIFFSEISENFNMPEEKNVIKTISLCFNTSRIERLQELREQFMDTEEDKGKQQDLNSRQFAIPDKMIHLLQGIEFNTCKKYAGQHKNPGTSDSQFVGSAFVSFKYQEYRDFILNKYQRNRSYFKYYDNILKISKAAHPSEILWSNLRVDSNRRKMKTAVSFFILFGFLILAFAVIVFSSNFKDFLMGFLKKQAKGNPMVLTLGGTAVTLITTVITLVINSFLKLFAENLTIWERHQTKSDEQLSLIIKMVCTQFVNTVIIYYFMSLIVNNETKSELQSQEGLIFQISSLVVTSGIIQIFVNFVYPQDIIRRLKILWYFYGKEDNEKLNMFQIRVNKIYELPEFDIAGRYSYYILQLFTISFYAYLIPLSSLAVGIILFFQFWVDKINMFKRSCNRYNFSYIFTQKIMILGEMSLFIYSLGVLIFSFKLSGEAHPLTYLGFFISLAFGILSLCTRFLSPQLEQKLFGRKEIFEQQSYDECSNSGKFHKNYWNLNPATHLTPNPMEYQLNQRQLPKQMFIPPCIREMCCSFTCRRKLQYPMYWCKWREKQIKKTSVENDSPSLEDFRCCYCIQKKYKENKEYYHFKCNSILVMEDRSTYILGQQGKNKLPELQQRMEQGRGIAQMIFDQCMAPNKDGKDRERLPINFYLPKSSHIMICNLCGKNKFQIGEPRYICLKCPFQQKTQSFYDLCESCVKLVRKKDPKIVKKIQKKYKNPDEDFNHEVNHPLVRVIFNATDDYYDY